MSESKEVKQGHIVARIVDDSQFRIDAKMYPDEFSKIELGQELALRFSIFDGTYYGTVTDMNPNPFPDGDEDNPAKGFVHRVTIEGKNQDSSTNLEVYVGLPIDKKTPQMFYGFQAFNC